MATKGDIQSDLTLEIDGSDVTPEKFLRGVRSFFAILTEVTTQVGGKRTAVQWTVQVREGSNLIGISPRAGFDPAVVARITDAVSGGISQLETLAAEPPYFTERAMKSLSELARVTDTDNRVRVWVRREPISVTAHSAANVGTILESEHEDYGSIEGRLRTITDRGGVQFVVYEPLWDRPVRCYIPEDLVNQAMEAWRDRVEVYGVIKYRKDGNPISINVDDLVPMIGSAVVPNFRDVHGILRED